MGKRTDGRSCDKPRELSLSSLEKRTRTQVPTKETNTDGDTESNKSSNSEAAKPSPKRANQKKTPPATTSTSANMAPWRRSTRHCQSALAKDFGNPIPINTIEESTTHRKLLNFNIDSPSDQIHPPTKRNLKSLFRKWASRTNHPSIRRL